ncbi:MAG: glutamate-5-semialdehyde dehydrogenase [Defluviitaleaceae bacterium]|nr:glutamate-5-semialdehyde dehydrogenase [Defluviitaleaceae bacterium]
MHDLERIGQAAKEASQYLARLAANQKNEVLLACADALEAKTDLILTENAKDMAAADPSRTAFNDRLRLDASRIKGMADGLRKVARLDDPVGEVLYMKTLPNGLQVGERRTPLGVVGMIYEARPNVTVDVAGLCFKSGNACILRGGSEALTTNIALVKILHKALASLGHPPHAVQLITDTSREAARDFMRLDTYVDVLIPRGGAGLIKTVKEHSRIPVIETGVGNCHIFVDASADLQKAEAIVINAKTQRPGVCNACEKLLVHADITDVFIPQICDTLTKAGVEIRGDDATQERFGGTLPAAEADWHEEFLSLVIAVKVVADIDEAIAHITRYSSAHSDAILTESNVNAQRFLAEIDSAAVYVNASTRFTDGEEFGLGAEIGISTQKLHARGPMGLKALTSTKFVIFGDGQVRA